MEFGISPIAVIIYTSGRDVALTFLSAETYILFTDTVDC